MLYPIQIARDKILCVLYLHYNVAFTFKWCGNSWNKTFYYQRVWIGYIIELAEEVYWSCREGNLRQPIKHYPDLGSDTSLAWNFCARSSDVITQRKPLVTSRNVGCFLRLYTSTLLKGRNNNDIHKSTHLSCFLYCLYSRSHGHRQSTIVLDHECMWRFASYYWNIAWRFGFLCTAFFLCKKEKKNI